MVVRGRTLVVVFFRLMNKEAPQPPVVVVVVALHFLNHNSSNSHLPHKEDDGGEAVISSNVSSGGRLRSKAKSCTLCGRCLLPRRGVVVEVVGAAVGVGNGVARAVSGAAAMTIALPARRLQSREERWVMGVMAVRAALPWRMRFNFECR